MVTFQYDNAGDGRAIVVCFVDGCERFRDKLDPNSALSRARFRKALAAALNGELGGVDVDAELAGIAQQMAAEQAAPRATVGDRAELLAARDAESADLLARMPPQVEGAARAMLAAPNLIDVIAADLATLGIVGERVTALTLYLAGVSRLLERPVSVLVQGPSSSGKTFVVNTVAKCFPPEAVLRASDITQQALYYLAPGSLLHRIVVGGERARAKAGHEDERAETTRALRQMISDGDLIKVVTTKTADGRLQTDVIHQYGPISYVETTTETNVFDEDQNRMLLAGTDETAEQTRRIIDAGARAAAGDAGDGAAIQAIIDKHHAAQRLLRRRPVVIPWAERLGAAMPAEQPQARRAIGQLLGTIRAAATLHQYQRQQTADGAILADLTDFGIAREVVAAPLARSLGGDLPGAAARLADRLRERFGVGPEGATFTNAEAAAGDTIVKVPDKVGGYLRGMLLTGDVERVEQGGGRSPSRWRMLAGDPAGVPWLPSLNDLARPRYDPEEDGITCGVSVG